MAFATVAAVLRMAAGRDDPPSKADGKLETVHASAAHHADAAPPMPSQAALDRAAQQQRDAAFLIRIRRDDEQALAELARIYALQLAALATSILGANAFAEDVVQDVFIDLWERRADVQMPANVAGYLHRAVQYRSISRRRHEQANERLETQLGAADPASRVAYNSAERQLAEADVTAQLHAALADVSPSPRRVFLLSWSGLSYQEIADVMGISTQSVRRQMHRATQRLALAFQRSRSPQK